MFAVMLACLIGIIYGVAFGTVGCMLIESPTFEPVQNFPKASKTLLVQARRSCFRDPWTAYSLSEVEFLIGYDKLRDHIMGEYGEKVTVNYLRDSEPVMNRKTVQA